MIQQRVVVPLSKYEQVPELSYPNQPKTIEAIWAADLEVQLSLCSIKNTRTRLVHGYQSKLKQFK